MINNPLGKLQMNHDSSMLIETVLAYPEDHNNAAMVSTDIEKNKNNFIPA